MDQIKIYSELEQSVDSTSQTKPQSKCLNEDQEDVTFECQLSDDENDDNTKSECCETQKLKLIPAQVPLAGSYSVRVSNRKHEFEKLQAKMAKLECVLSKNNYPTKQRKEKQESHDKQKALMKVTRTKKVGEEEPMPESTLDCAVNSVHKSKDGELGIFISYSQYKKSILGKRKRSLKTDSEDEVLTKIQKKESEDQNDLIQQLQDQKIKNQNMIKCLFANQLRLLKENEQMKNELRVNKMQQEFVGQSFPEKITVL